MAARLARRVKADLIAQVGGSPSPAQMMLIESIVTLRLHCERFELQALQNGGELTEHARKAYLAFRNSYVRSLRALEGLKASKPDQTSSDVFAAARSGP